MAAPDAFLWDTCVLYRWLNARPPEYLDHIKNYLDDAESNRTDLYLSSVTLAEIAPSKVNRPGLSPSQVLAAISSSFIMVDTSPDIMSLAGYLRDQRYRQVDGPDKRAATRELSLGDAIHLATAIALREDFGVQNLALHTFDEGKSRDGESGKRTVPLIGFQNWCRDIDSDEEIQKVLTLRRSKPTHPNCPLP